VTTTIGAVMNGWVVGGARFLTDTLRVMVATKAESICVELVLVLAPSTRNIR